MILRLGLDPALTLQKRIRRGAIFTALMIYLEGVVVLVLLTESRLSPSSPRLPAAQGSNIGP